MKAARHHGPEWATTAHYGQVLVRFALSDGTFWGFHALPHKRSMHALDGPTKALHTCLWQIWSINVAS